MLKFWSKVIKVKSLWEVFRNSSLQSIFISNMTLKVVLN